jgi:class 3 adenylate cyclase
MILVLARLNSPRAFELYEEWDLARTHTGNRALDIDIAALGARLMKERALAAPAGQRAQLLRNAAERYLAAFQLTGDFYPGTNAASLHFWAGDKGRALAIAADVEARIKGSSFYETAARAECALIMGEIERAKGHLEALEGRGTPAERMVARTHLRRSCEILSVDLQILTPLKPGSVVHFMGSMPRPDAPLDGDPVLIARIAALLDDLDASIGFGALAAGADILFAEALLARGAELNVVLPFAPEDFLKTSVGAHTSGDWPARFDTCLAGASQVSVVGKAFEDGDPLQYGYGTMISAGLTLLRARHLEAPATQVAIWDGSGSVASYGTAAGIALWQKTALQQHVIDATGTARPLEGKALADDSIALRRRNIRFVLFGDIAGFSRLSDEQIAILSGEVMTRLAQACQPSANDILARNSWGDGIYLVFAQAASAAATALAMQETMARIDFTGLGLPELQLRLGLHCGPMTSMLDPLTGRETFMGGQVNRAARIEPLTPPGTVYATEAFAACLALDREARFVCEYIGKLTAGKGTEQLRLLSLSRQAV